MEKEKKVIKPYSCKPRSPRRVITPVGEAVLPQTRYYVEDGIKKAEPAQGIDLVPFLKASQAGTDLATIVSRLESGDTSVINVKANGISGDFVHLPRSVNDLADLRRNMSKTFEGLKPEVKALFKDAGDFYSSCMDGSLSTRLSVLSKNVEEKSEVKSEVKPEVKEG